MVSKGIAVSVAGWTGPCSVIHWTPEPVSQGEHKLTGLEVKPKSGDRHCLEPSPCTRSSSSFLLLLSSSSPLFRLSSSLSPTVSSLSWLRRSYLSLHSLTSWAILRSCCSLSLPPASSPPPPFASPLQTFSSPPLLCAECMIPKNITVSEASWTRACPRRYLTIVLIVIIGLIIIISIRLRIAAEHFKAVLLQQL